MSIEIRVPQLPESVADATLVAWRKQVGERVSRDENLADLETDKVVLEVPAPGGGVLKEFKVQAGTVVRSGDLLAIFDLQAISEEGAAVVTSPASAETARLSPSAKRMVEENKLDPRSIPATGKDGLLTKSDVVGFLDKQPVVSPPAAAPASALATNKLARSGRSEQRVPMTRLRQRIAERLVQAQATQALLTSFNEVDLTAVNDLRTRYKERFEREHAVKLGFMSFFVRASIEALKKFPIVNASVDGTDTLYHEFYDIGVAVSTDRGLVVPIVRDADGKSFAELEKEIAAFAAKARAGALTIDDLSGGTFTITNGGVFGSLLSTPIVNSPQSAILGMHKIQERPMVVNGAIVARPMMYLALTYDHRIIDGRDAVQFLVTLKDALEDPGRMLLGI